MSTVSGPLVTRRSTLTLAHMSPIFKLLEEDFMSLGVRV